MSQNSESSLFLACFTQAIYLFARLFWSSLKFKPVMKGNLRLPFHVIRPSQFKNKKCPKRRCRVKVRQCWQNLDPNLHKGWRTSPPNSLSLERGSGQKRAQEDRRCRCLNLYTVSSTSFSGVLLTEVQPAKTVKKTEAPKEKASPWVTTVGKRTLGLRCVDPVKSLWFPSQIWHCICQQTSLACQAKPVQKQEASKEKVWNMDRE